MFKNNFMDKHHMVLLSVVFSSRQLALKCTFSGVLDMTFHSLNERMSSVQSGGD